MITILAHRANLTGPHSVVENSLAACAAALEAGFGLETDLRCDPSGAFYISHDAQPLSPENRLEPFSDLFRKYPAATLAINVKEPGLEAALIELRHSRRLGPRSFFFDFELLEPDNPGAAQCKIKSLPGSPAIRLAARLSDRNEPLSQCLAIPAEIVWADEFDSLWLTENEVKQVRAAGRAFYVISPELHGFDPTTMKRRWQDFKSWGVDGLCTDYPKQARGFFNS